MVLIDRSSIITDLDQLFESKFEFCYSVDDDVLRLPENHRLRRLIEKNKNCFFDLSARLEPLDLTNRAFFVNPKFIRSILSVYIKEKADAIYWISAPVFFDSQLVFYYRVGLTGSQIKSIDNFAQFRLESGLYSYMYDFALIELERRNGKNLQIFNDLNEFLETFTVFGAITLSSLKACFCILLLCELLVFFLFLCSKTLAFLKRYCIWLLFWISRSLKTILTRSVEKVQATLNTLFSTVRRSFV